MYFAVFLLALSMTMVSIPWVLMIAQHWNLVDLPDNERKIHSRAIPALGGIGIMVGFLTSLAFVQGMEDYFKMIVIVICTIILTLVGIRDDLFHMKAQHKFLWQLTTALLFSYLMSHWQYSFRGFLGINQFPVVFGIAFAILVLVFFTNAFNLIDGIDGLAGSIGLWIAFSMGVVSYLAGDRVFSLLSFALVGSLIGFLRFNMAPAKIFMLDTGSLTVGFLLAVFCLRFLSRESYKLDQQLIPLYLNAPSVALSFLIIPVYDTARVIFLRISRRLSPFNASRDHIHHALLLIGLRHSTATIYLLSVNIIISILALILVYSGFTQVVVLGAVVFSCLLLLPTGGQKRKIWHIWRSEVKPLFLANPAVDHTNTEKLIQLDPIEQHKSQNQ